MRAIWKRIALRVLSFGVPSLSLGKHAAKRALHFFAVPCCVIPVDGTFQSIAEEQFGLPSEQSLRQGVIGDAVERARGHVGPQLYFRFVACEVANHFRGVDDPDALHRSQIDSRAVVDFLTSYD